MIFTFLGILSSIIFLIGDIPYLLDTLKSKTQPQRVTWGVVFLLNTIGFANQMASGATNSLWLFGSASLMTGAIFLASFKYGVGGHSRTDILITLAALAGVLLWFLFNSPLFSIIANVFVVTVALLPTFKKAKIDPRSETRVTWLLGTISVVMAAISVGELIFSLLILPVSSALLQGYMVYLLYIRSNKLENN